MQQFAVIFPKLKDSGEEGLAVLLGEVAKKLPPNAEDEAKEKLAKRQANAAVALLRMNKPAKVWPLPGKWAKSGSSPVHCTCSDSPPSVMARASERHLSWTRA